MILQKKFTKISGNLSKEIGRKAKSWRNAKKKF